MHFWFMACDIYWDTFPGTTYPVGWTAEENFYINYEPEMI